MKEHLSANELFELIVSNDELRGLELNGFVTGGEQGKTMNASIDTLFESLNKQNVDFLKTWYDHSKGYNYKKLKRCLADLRNVAGCMFLKLQEMEKETK